MRISVSTFFLFGVFGAVASWSAVSSEMPPTNLWVGSGGWPHTSGMNSPAATTPFGLVRLGPDTKPAFPFTLPLFNKIGYYTSGYGYPDRRIFGFSHTRLMGTGGRDGGVFRVLPLGRLPKRPQSASSVRFRHRDERANPGYYAIDLPSENMTAELTASPHCGFHRYRKGAGESTLNLLLNVTSGLIKHPGSLDGKLAIDPVRRALSGSTRTRGDFSARVGGLPTYFYAEYSKPVAGIRVWGDRGWLAESVRDAAGEELGIALSAPDRTDELELNLCVSHVSVANAKLNFEAEARGVNFDAARVRAEGGWKDYFARAAIRTRDPELAALYYTTLYFSAVMPTNFTDVNGEYLGFDQKIGFAEHFTYRTDFSLWDTFRTANPLYNLIAPETTCDVVESLLRMAKGPGVFPRLAFGTESLDMMFGSPANFVVAEARLKGICDFDTAGALAAMWKGANGDEFTRERACVDLGYCPSDRTTQSVSKTLENAWADFAAAELAQSAGDSVMEARFREREVAFRNVWDPSTRYFRPKNSAGEFTAFNPHLTSYFEFLYQPAIHYAEGGPNHYRYSAPHHARELVALFGGPAAFVAELESFLEGATPHRSALNPGSKYWHGNEHDIHAIYLFNEAGRPDLTQAWARWALRDRYALAPDGLDGNDDAGTLSAWYVLSSLGL